MLKILPVPKDFNVDESKLNEFNRLFINFNELKTRDRDTQENIKKIIKIKLANFEDLSILYDKDINKYSNNEIFEIVLIDNLPDNISGSIKGNKLFFQQGYVLKVKDRKIFIYFNSISGFTHAVSTLKQIIKKENKEYYSLPELYILDYPEIEKRSLSTTFAWYAGYGRVGFDMQLWGYEEWKDFLNICSDYKINQLNMCMYGYWPFEFEEFPETVFKDFKMKVWNKESKNWVEIEYLHPNIANKFLNKLIEYAHDLSIDIYTYIGLNSYNGGYSNIYKEKRMKMPEDSKFINDFDTLCLNSPGTIDYLKKAVRKIVSLGFDGIIFEESEESFWFCNCEKCKKEFIDKTLSPAEAKHMANYKLLRILHNEIKDENPDCNVGLRAWREPPLEKDIEYLKNCKDSIPKDVCLYWAPGLYVGENEFSKWVDVFGKDRICARDTEANAISACMGRLFRIFRSNILRSEEETNHQFIENDINQHKGSAELGCKGINGYLFEFYGFFLHFFTHANYGWHSKIDEEEFYKYAIDAVFGEDLRDDILYILENIFTIHESQISIFTSVFPFLRNKVNKNDISRLEKAKNERDKIEEKIKKVKRIIENDEKLRIYYKHFDKIENAHKRNFYIYDLCLSSIKYDNARNEEERIKYLKEMYYYNEKDFELAKDMFFDINPVSATGVKACMFPYHEIKRVINNILNPENKDNNQIYLGVEALGWLWL